MRRKPRDCIDLINAIMFRSGTSQHEVTLDLNKDGTATLKTNDLLSLSNECKQAKKDCLDLIEIIRSRDVALAKAASGDDLNEDVWKMARDVVLDNLDRSLYRLRESSDSEKFRMMLSAIRQAVTDHMNDPADRWEIYVAPRLTPMPMIEGFNILDGRDRR